MAKAIANKSTARSGQGRSQDRAKIAGGQDYEVAYVAEKTGKSPSAVKKAVKSEGNSRAAVEAKLSRSKGR
jgi:hypothetical protein